MKFNIQKMMDIKTPKDLEKINLNKPVFYKNYLFHYLIMFDKLELLKINKHPVFQFNEENLDIFLKCGLNGSCIRALSGYFLSSLNFKISKVPRYSG